MKIRFLWIIPLLFTHLQAEITLAQQAEAAWQERDKPGQTERAISLWQQAAKAEPARADLWIDLTKACGRAVRHASNAAERKRWAERALGYGKNAVACGPQSSSAYAYYAEALGQWANSHKGLHSLRAVDQAVEALHKAISLDPKNAYAHMLLAEFYRQSPRLLSVGNKEKALEEARLAVQYAPQYAIHHLVLARACLDLGKKDEGIAQLQLILTLAAPADVVPETRADQASALALLKDLGMASSVPACGETGGYCTDEKP
jgi:tetratricopeptide (TPR) repeat protein